MAGAAPVTVGTDLVFVPGFREQLADPASRFVAATFTEGERRAAELRAESRQADPALPRDPAPHLAARFAAKEAFLKAWDQRFFGEAPPLPRGQVDLRHIEVVSDAWGRPTLRLHGDVARHVGPLTAALSLSHDGPFATAVVILHEVRP